LTPFRSSSNFLLSDARDYATTDRVLGERERDETRLPGNGVQPAAARGPSFILPSIRDLHTIPDPSLNAPAPALPDHQVRSQTKAPAVQGFRAGEIGAPSHSPSGLPGSIGGRQDPYAGSSVPQAMHAQPQPPLNPVVIYQSDSEHSSRSYSPSRHSNLGIMGGTAVDSKTKQRRANLPISVTDILRAWFHEHLDHPYPTGEDKQMFATLTGLNISQVRFSSLIRDHHLLTTCALQISNWFTNARRRQRPAKSVVKRQ
jgi:hypothetical protein